MERPLLQEHVVPAAGRQWWTWTALAATALVLSCLQLISIHRVGELQSAVAPLTLQLSPATEAVQLSHLKIKGKLLEKPGKYLIGGLTPPVDQGSRANCWLFAIVGVLEDSYRRQGIERGWLSEDMYLYLSRQSLGISIMDICKKHPSGLCPATTSADGSVIAWGNTTNWADEKLLWYLKELGTKALPGSVCPYTVSATGEKVCEGMEAALQTNPLEFKVKRADIFYDIPDMQRALIEKKRALTFSISVLKAEFFFPCTKATAKTYKGCDPEGDQCVPCPLTRAFVGIACCIPQTRAAVTMAGEWYHRPNGKQLVLGGHAINAVGYTDSYTDEWGNKGGLIVRHACTVRPGPSSAGPLCSASAVGAQLVEGRARLCARRHGPWITLGRVVHARGEREGRGARLPEPAQPAGLGDVQQRRGTAP